MRRKQLTAAMDREIEYARGDINPQDIDSYWSNLKRGDYAVFGHVTEKHLPPILATLVSGLTGGRLSTPSDSLHALTHALGWPVWYWRIRRPENPFSLANCLKPLSHWQRTAGGGMC